MKRKKSTSDHMTQPDVSSSYSFSPLQQPCRQQNILVHTNSPFSHHSSEEASNKARVVIGIYLINYHHYFLDDF